MQRIIIVGTTSGIGLVIASLYAETLDKQILEIEGELVKRAKANPKMMFKLKSIPGISVMGAITLLSRIGDITRFKTPPPNRAKQFRL